MTQFFRGIKNRYFEKYVITNNTHDNEYFAVKGGINFVLSRRWFVLKIC